VTALRGAAALICAAAVSIGLASAARAQASTPDKPVPASHMNEASGVRPVMDNAIYTHILLDQFEDRWSGRNQEFRYEGQAWSGTDLNRLWLKSEGTVTPRGRFTDGQHEILYDRALTTYFDLQAGVRIDLDSAVTRTWGAVGIQGLALYFFDIEATAYASDRGRFAGRLRASYDLFLTQRLILQPEVELNVYSKPDPARGIGSGLSEIDTGLRLRYEITRKFAPYVGVAYAGRLFQTASLARREGESPNDLRFVFGVRLWY
jgi:copper resistance protein B